MDSVKRATDALKRAETSLRTLVSEAAAAGDYASVVRIAAWARTVSELVRAAPGASARGAKMVAENGVRYSARPVPPARRSHGQGREVYPRFLRNGDTLIRIAWSKKEGKEYQHRAPLAVIRALAKSMVEAGTDGRVFSTDQLLPLRDEVGSEVPSYQAYVGIALLKQAGLIDQHGRQGYSIPQLSEFAGAVEAIWRQLPSA